MPGPALDSEALLLRNPSAMVEHVGTETVLLNPERETFLRLNRSGSRVWEALEQPRSVGALAELLAATYGLDEERAKTDVEPFVGELQRHGLIDVRRP